jgi:hypothetical protein
METEMSWLTIVIIISILSSVATAMFFLLRFAIKRVGGLGTGIRAYAGANIISIIVGLLISTFVAVIIWLGIVLLLGHFLPGNRFPRLAFLLHHGLGLGIGAFIAYVEIFYPGITPEVNPGQKAYMKIFGIPFGKFGVGYAWTFPWFMEFKIIDTTAIQEKDEGKKEYLTKNGVEIFVESESTYSIDDPLAAQGIQTSSISEFVKSVRHASVREWIAEKSFNIEPALKVNPSLEEQVGVALLINGLKGEIASQGPGEIIRRMNEKLAEFGLKVSQVQFREVLFSEKLEESAQLLFEEMLQAGGRARNAANMNTVAQTITEGVLRDAGTDRSTLTREELLALADKNFARAMAMEDQGGYNFNDFGGRVPPGVMVTTPSAQPRQGGTST